MTDGVPIGVLRQVKPRPGVEDEVLGLAAVKEWTNGYFILEGFSPEGEQGRGHDELDAAYDRAKAATSPFSEQEFDPFDRFDARERQIAQVIGRRGQSKFRSVLIAAYRGQCVVTGCDAVDALEAAHISAYLGKQSNHVQNGLLLREDHAGDYPPQAIGGERHRRPFELVTRADVQDEQDRPHADRQARQNERTAPPERPDGVRNRLQRDSGRQGLNHREVHLDADGSSRSSRSPFASVKARDIRPTQRCG
jgi:hypothetical protein